MINITVKEGVGLDPELLFAGYFDRVDKEISFNYFSVSEGFNSVSLQAEDIQDQKYIDNMTSELTHSAVSACEKHLSGAGLKHDDKLKIERIVFDFLNR